MGAVRPPAVAGTFYPADPGELAAVVDRLLADADPPPLDIEPTLLVVPHAGYVYSGPVAATAFRLVGTADRRFVMVGPSHFVAVAGMATAAATGLATPLGVVAVDDELSAVAEARHGVAPLATAHAREHSLEVQLPFLQRTAGRASVLPLLTGDAAADRVADVLEDALDLAGVKAIVSTDLSHYLDSATARHRDAATAAAVVEMRPDAIGRDDACGATGLRAAVITAARRHWEFRLLDLRNSGDTAGPTDRVVGYGAFAAGPVVRG
jgi:AmmeMemoRadiSam system protein B